MTDDLALAPTEDLVAELARRHTGLLVVMERPAEDGGDRTETNIQWKGGVNLALGLARRAQFSVQREIALAMIEDEEDDDGED